MHQGKFFNHRGRGGRRERLNFIDFSLRPPRPLWLKKIKLWDTIGINVGSIKLQSFRFLQNLISVETNLILVVNMSETQSNQCPFSKQGANYSGLSLSKHAQNLSTAGLGPVSRMVKESLLETERSNAALPDLHAAEAAKFAAMARRIAPVDLIAAQMSKYFASLPVVSVLYPDNLYKAFADIVRVTEDSPEYSRPGQKKYLYTYSESCAYLRYCSNQPTLLLACFYLSVGLQKCMIDLAGEISDETLGKDVREFGKHFNATNLLSTLPMALSASLVKIKGEKAAASQLDNAVITEALKNLHDDGRFVIRVNGLAKTETAGKVAIFQCPMEGYLFNLLCSNQVLENIIAAIGRADQDLLRFNPDNCADEIKSLILMAHFQNTESVKKIATYFLETL